MHLVDANVSNFILASSSPLPANKVTTHLPCLMYSLNSS
ncbi:hypothetical protein CP01DC11_1455 [Chlamydia psittaci 01DC11]|nr:hypothetical protein CP01DC11_1455 [Chlamydia psittaci 01DC11]